MPKLITFDGPSASGKFTNSVKLCEYLGIERVNDTAFTVMKHMIESNLLVKNPVLRPLLWLGIVKLSHTFDWQKRDIFTLGGFWQHIIDYFAWHDISDNRDVLMDAFDTIMLSDGDSYPICSFYLDISTHNAQSRFIKRETQHRELRVEAVDLSESPDHKERDSALKGVANWLSERYPFFHVIDASRSEDAVFDEIVSLTEAAL